MSQEGFQFHIPDDALQPGEGECKVEVETYLANSATEFEFPKDTEPISAVTHILLTRKLQKVGVFDLEHCGDPRECKRVFMRFVRAPSKPPYRFERMESGATISGSHGGVEVSESSWYAIVEEKDEGDITFTKQYCGQLYCESDHFTKYQYHFIITRNLRICTEVKLL